MPWRPITEQHAIERVRVTLTLERPITPKKIRSLQSDHKARLFDLGLGVSSVLQGQAIAVQMGPQGPVAVQQPQEVNGWVFQRNSAAGSPIEGFQLAENALSYETVEYSRWTVFMERFEAVVMEIARELLSLDDAASLALDYHDAFLFDGDPQEAVPSGLLRIAGDVVPAPAQDGRELWHVHRGWFEEGNHGRLLVQHNLSATDEAPQGRPARVVRIVTRAEGRKGYWDLADDELRPHLDTMHDRTKHVFADALTDEACVEVGINPEER